MKIAISADSSCDISKELIAKYDVHIIPFTVVLGEKVGLDGEIKADDIFNYVSETRQPARTSSINAHDFSEHFTNLLKDYDLVVHFSLTQTMSSAYNNAVMAANDFKGKVIIFDSRTISVGLGLEIAYFRDLEKTGKYSVEEMLEKVSNRIEHMVATIILGTTEYLYISGRCSSAKHLGAKILGIRPQVIIQDGLMKVHKHRLFRGKDAVVVKKFIRSVLEEFDNPDKSIALVAATKVPETTYDIITEQLKDAGFKFTSKVDTSATISCHGGPGAIGLVYWNDGGVEL